MSKSSLVLAKAAELETFLVGRLADPTSARALALSIVQEATLGQWLSDTLSGEIPASFTKDGVPVSFTI